MTDTKTDWERFAARVQAGTIVIGERTCCNYRESGWYEWYNPSNKQGVLISHRDRDFDMTNPRIQFEDQPIERTCVPAKRLKYLIDGRWLTFDQLMAGEA